MDYPEYKPIGSYPTGSSVMIKGREKEGAVQIQGVDPSDTEAKNVVVLGFPLHTREVKKDTPAMLVSLPEIDTETLTDQLKEKWDFEPKRRKKFLRW